MDNLQNVRLECLKIAATRQAQTAEIVGAAKKFEEYILDKAEVSAKEEQKPQGKKGKSEKLESLL